MKTLFDCILICTISLSTLIAETTISADVVSRYVWRGTDFGNAAAVQPGIETAVGPVTVGAWGSWALNGADGGNECDLYASFTAGPVGITVTDYFFPVYAGVDSLTNIDMHTIELSAGTDVGTVSVLAASNVSGDDNNSTYLEFTYGALSLGVGNGAYSTDGKFSPVSIGVSASRDNFSASYINNPDQDTSFLVFGVNF